MSTKNQLILTNDNGDKQLIRTLGNGSEIRNVTTKMELATERGELYGMTVKSGEQYVKRNVITAAGFYKMNQNAGISFISPPTIVDDNGKEVGNPYPCPTEDKKEVKYVKVRRIGIGRNSVGNLVAIDYTLTYDMSLYRAEAFLSKWKGTHRSSSFQSWGELYSTDNIPKKALEGARKVIDCPGGVSLVVDLTNRDVINLICDHVNRQKFAERNAITICERNILKKFFATSFTDDGTVKVVAWPQADRNMQQLARAVVEAGEGHVEAEGEQIEVQVASEVIDDPEEMRAALSGDMSEDDPQEDVEEGEFVHAEESVDSIRAAIRNALDVAKSNGKTESARSILQKHNLVTLKQIAECKSVDVLGAIRNELLEVMKG